MSGLDFLFGLFSLLLGLAMAEVLGGFASVMKLHARARAGKNRDVRVGLLVPMLAIFVLMGQISCWTIFFGVREQLPFNYLALVVMTLIIGAYYLFASVVWPDEPGEWPDFDAYYDLHNRFILIGNLVLNFVGAAVTNLFGAPPERAGPRITDPTVVDIALSLLALALLLNVILIFVRGRRLNVVLLGSLIVMQLGGSIAFAVALGSVG